MPEGVTAFGRFWVTSFLRHSSAGVEYMARDPAGGGPVVLLVPRIPEEAIEASRFRDRFMAQARAAMELRHPAIVAIQEVAIDEATQRPFVVLEHVPGVTLAEKLKVGHRFGEAEAAGIASAVAEALGFAAERGIVHGALTPAHVILTAKGTTKVAGFGVEEIARTAFDAPGESTGGATYYAPEQLRGAAADQRSDLFVLGLILYEMLTSAHPFEAPLPSLAAERILTDTPEPPAKLRPDLSASFNGLVFALLHKAPMGRPASGTEVAHTLAAIQRTAAAAAAKAKAAPARSTPHGGPGRRTAIIVAGGAVVVALLALAIGLWPRGPNAPPAAPVPTAAASDGGAKLRAAEAALAAGDIIESRRLVAELEAGGAVSARLSELHQAVDAQAVEKGQLLFERAIRLADEKRWDEAAAVLADVLALAPSNAKAADYLRRVKEAKAAEDQRQTQAAAAPEAEGRVAAAQGPTLGVYFSSPIPAGRIDVALDGKPFASKAFDFARGEFMGLQRRAGGLVQETWQVPDGSHAVAVRLLGGKGELLGQDRFTLAFGSGPGFKVVVEMRTDRTTPTMVAVPLPRRT